MIDTAVCVMAKAPVPGRVKTRLVPPLSAEQAAILAAAFLADTWRAASALDSAIVLLACAGDGRWPQAVAGAPRFPQPEGDLGVRIEAACAEGLARAPAVLVLGSDVPGLPTAHLRAARRALDDSDAVIGPSADGGYYLIGVRRPIRGVLADVAWSAEDTRDQTIRVLCRAGLSVGFAPPFDDVDEPTDLDELRRGLSAGTVTAEATRRALATMR